MSLLAEYALTPDVFDQTAYSSPEVFGLHLQTLRQVLLHQGLVRDLRGGEWGRCFRDPDRPCHPRVKELVRKLGEQARLLVFPSTLDAAPKGEGEWRDEALATHSKLALDGIIVSDRLPVAGGAADPIQNISRLASATWWTRRSQSIRLGRNLAAYQQALELVLRHANSIMMIDPHLNLSERRYADAVKLLCAAGGRSPLPRVEIHRVAWQGTSRDKLPKSAEVEAALRPALAEANRLTGLPFEVFLWDDFHDRYLISNLIGISVPHGFDTTKAPDAKTTWTALDRADSDDIQREFDPSAHRHRLHHRFRLP